MRAFLVEDEYLIELLVEEMLGELGHEIAEAAATCHSALTCARKGGFDFALLDLELSDGFTYPVADVLDARRTPYAFMTGHDHAEIPPGYAAVPVLSKPFRCEDLATAVSRLLDKNCGLR
jgi:CheY-like chemotaxis protein